MIARLRLTLLLGLTLVLAACATSAPSRMQLLLKAQYDYSAALRWSDYEGAYQFVDPAQRAADPLTPFELSRMQQFQITGYDVLGTSPTPDGEARTVQIRMANRHTQTERVIRAAELWRYDAKANTWWQTTGLPDWDATVITPVK